MILSFNGQITDPQDAKISVTSETVMFGKGVFESFIVEAGQAFLLDPHLDRFLAGLQTTNLNLPVTKTQLHQWIKSLYLAQPSEVLRFKVMGTCEGVWIFSNVMEQLRHEPWVLRSYKGHRSLAAIKSTSYLECLLAHEQATGQGADEALLCNHHGMIYEGSRSNFYWLAGGKLRSKKRGVLPGVTREFIAINHPGGIHWESLQLSLVHQIEGAFVSNGIRGLLPVSQIDDVLIPVTDAAKELCHWFAEARSGQLRPL